MRRSVLDIIAETLRDEGRPAEEIYRFLLGQFVGTNYIWGGSSICGSDCSGSVCASLSRAIGKEFRVTADELYRSYFTRTAASVPALEGEIGAAFFLDGEGKAVHVAGYRGGGVFVNVSRMEPGGKASCRSYDELRLMYPDFRPQLRVFARGERALPAGAGGKAWRRGDERLAV